MQEEDNVTDASAVLVQIINHEHHHVSCLAINFPAKVAKTLDLLAAVEFVCLHHEPAAEIS